MRTMHIYCDGGFGNRLNGLISGLALCAAADIQPLVVWPVNNWCGAAFHDLFEADLPVVERELSSYAPVVADFQFLTITDHLAMGMSYRSPLALSSLDEARQYLAQRSADIHFHTPLVPPWVGLPQTLHWLRTLPPVEAIRARAARFIAERALTRYFGVQIRKTDFGNHGADDQQLFDLIGKCAAERFFVCSDDAAVEQRFKALGNVVVHDKTAHVERLVHGDWTAHTTDYSGRVYASNVKRSRQSVIDAVVDLLILSHSQVVKTSNSTFLHMALLLQASRAAA